MKNKNKLIALGIAVLIFASVAVCFSACSGEKAETPSETSSVSATDGAAESTKMVFETREAPEVIKKGECGASATWEYDDEKKMLEISGEGTVDDPSGWNGFASLVEAVRINEGITDFEITVFDALINAEDYYFPTTMDKAKEYKFKKSEYYLNRAGREDGILYRDGVLVDVEPVISGVFEVVDGTREIGESAFADTEVTKIIIPDSVTKINNCAFADCHYLQEIVIGSGVSQFGDLGAEFMFVWEGIEYDSTAGAPLLKKITVSPTNKLLSAEDGVLYNKDKTSLICYPSSKNSIRFTVPDSVTEIKNNAFLNTVNLKKLFIGKNVKSLGEHSMLNSYDGKENEPPRQVVPFEIYYEGTKEEWRKLSHDYFYSYLSESPVTYYNSEPFGTNSEGYMAAYNEFLKNYNGGEYESGSRFDLVYFTEDSIPELFVTNGDYHASSVEIMTFVDGEVVRIYEGGSWGRLRFIERQSIVDEGWAFHGMVIGSVVKVNIDGTEEVLFSYEDNEGSCPPESDQIYYRINGKNVTKDEYLREIEENVPENTSEFAEGIPLTVENIDKYCV